MMQSDEIWLSSMSVVSKLTDLTPRQIRYYETHELIKPERTEGQNVCSHSMIWKDY